jgi:hypothetical protein
MSQKHQIVYLNEHLTKHQTYIDIGRMGFESPFLGTNHNLGVLKDLLYQPFNPEIPWVRCALVTPYEA